MGVLLLVSIRGERSNTFFFYPRFVNIDVHYHKYILGTDTIGPFLEKVQNYVISTITSVTVPSTVQAEPYCMTSYNTIHDLNSNVNLRT